MNILFVFSMWNFIICNLSLHNSVISVNWLKLKENIENEQFHTLKKIYIYIYLMSHNTGEFPSSVKRHSAKKKRKKKRSVMFTSDTD